MANTAATKFQNHQIPSQPSTSLMTTARQGQDGKEKVARQLITVRSTGSVFLPSLWKNGKEGAARDNRPARAVVGAEMGLNACSF